MALGGIWVDNYALLDTTPGGGHGASWRVGRGGGLLLLDYGICSVKYEKRVPRDNAI